MAGAHSEHVATLGGGWQGGCQLTVAVAAFRQPVAIQSGVLVERDGHTHRQLQRSETSSYWAEVDSKAMKKSPPYVPAIFSTRST